MQYTVSASYRVVEVFDLAHHDRHVAADVDHIDRRLVHKFGIGNRI